MKVVCILILLVPMVGFAQRQPVERRNGWRIDSSRSLIWQHVEQDSTITSLDVIETLRSYSWIRDVQQYGSTVFAIADDYRIDDQKYKISSGWPFAYEDLSWDMAIRIDLKEDRYRITVSSITYDEGKRKNVHDKVQLLIVPIEQEVLTRDRTLIRPSYFAALDFLEQVLLDKLMMRSRALAEEW